MSAPVNGGTIPAVASATQIRLLGWLVLLIAGFAVFAATLGTDGTPDFKIYHHYNGFAALHQRSALDVVPAQMQTNFFPGLDRIYYLLFDALNNQPVLLNMLLSVPYGVAAFLAFLIARLFAGRPSVATDLVCAACAVLGLTGAGGLPTLATTMSDIVPGVPFLAALTVWLYLEADNRHTVWSALAIGLCAGLSVGLKLTLAPLFVGLFVAIVLRRGVSQVRAGALQAFVFGLGGLATFAFVDAGWLLGNWHAYGNPIFPFMNQVFKSDYVDHSPWSDLRFMPKTVKMALFYPAYWAFLTTHLAIELDMRDGRILVGLLGAIILLAGALFHMVRRPAGNDLNGKVTAGLALALTFLISYVLWEKLWSIYRYLSVTETISGAVLLAGLVQWGGARPKWFWPLILTTATIVTVMTTTRYPWWSRAHRADQAIAITLPPLEPDAMVVFLDSYAYSYLVPSFPGSVKVVGANNNFIRPGSWGKLQALAEATINGHQGPFWGFEFPKAFPGDADKTLAFYHLERDGACVPLVSNIEDQTVINICRLRRTQE
ncbi:hypothetical protein [Nitrospirillum iridis]|uniref:Glycosyltransferase RgtA/B/C/D-like domain-containing protein n=1 Tax=Nitrospirillum iridis TaxID=765888 RepID=A0A7X0EEG1_9PROT|nr:hypothetical protein [Nitrospirillum iridis]MBB6252990.1 hypothetical protein [Nitrospirillum iridis]